MKRRNWGTLWNEIMWHGKPLEKERQPPPTLTKEQIRFVIRECERMAYQVLSDASVSKTTAKMSEEGREVVADIIAKRLGKVLFQLVAK